MKIMSRLVVARFWIRQLRNIENEDNDDEDDSGDQIMELINQFLNPPVRHSREIFEWFIECKHGAAWDGRAKRRQ